ncbi:hypothetical protein [Ferruginibacter sp.]|nr:hypothetical protein [Ferruginibacter sp.]
MKKLIIVLAVGMLAGDGMAQTGTKAGVPPPPPPMEIKDMPAPPPPPPLPPKGVKFTPPVIVNDKGYTITVQPTTEEPVILLRKKGVTQKIRMSVWNAKPEYFENKYGQLPPPPPPAPPMPAKPPKAPVPPVKE